MEVYAPYPGVPAPIVQDYNPPAEPERDLGAMPAFFGGVGSDIFTGQSGDVRGNFTGVADSYDYTLVSSQAYGGSDWMTVGTDLNNGSEKQALSDMSAAIQQRLNGLPLATPPGNAAQGVVELVASVGAWCPLAVAGAAIGAAATMSKFPGSKPIALMAFSAVGVAVAKCESIVLNPDANEMAAYDAILHSAVVATQALQADYGPGGGGPMALPSLGSLAGTTASTGSGWNLTTSSGATIDWTKSYIDSITHNAVMTHA